MGRLVGLARVVARHLGPGFVAPMGPDVEELVVPDGERGRGTGRRLMRAGTEWAEPQGYPEIWVTAWSFNEPAAALDRRERLVPLGTRSRRAPPWASDERSAVASETDQTGEPIGTNRRFDRRSRLAPNGGKSLYYQAHFPS